MKPKTVLKRIYTKPVPGKRSVYEVLYDDGHKAHTSYIEIHGPSVMRYDKALGRHVVETRANVSLGSGKACVICGDDTSDKHVHA